MAEIVRAVKPIYGEIKGYLISLPLGDRGPYVVSRTIVDNFNSALDRLYEVSQIAYSRFKVPESAHTDYDTTYDVNVVRAQMQAVITLLEEEHDFTSQSAVPSPAIVIMNQNSNKVSLDINYTINDLIIKIEDEEVKEKLKKLDDELAKPSANWDIIKNILIWILNFSKDLFLQVLPILIQRYFKN